MSNFGTITLCMSNPVSTGKELLGGNIITVEFEPVIGESSDTEAVSDF